MQSHVQPVWSTCDLSGHRSLRPSWGPGHRPGPKGTGKRTPAAQEHTLPRPPEAEELGCNLRNPPPSRITEARPKRSAAGRLLLAGGAGVVRDRDSASPNLSFLLPSPSHH